MTKKQPVTPEILKVSGFEPDASVEPLDLGGEGFVADNCRVSIRLNGPAAAIRIQLETGSSVTFDLDVARRSPSPRALN